MNLKQKESQERLEKIKQGQSTFTSKQKQKGHFNDKATKQNTHVSSKNGPRRSGI